MTTKKIAKRRKTKKKKKTPPIKFRQALFWDVDPKTIDLKKNAAYVIERILDFGNDKEIQWLSHFYRRDTIHRVVKRSRALRPQTKPLWLALTKKCLM
jgi:hypothetical protein